MTKPNPTPRALRAKAKTERQEVADSAPAAAPTDSSVAPPATDPQTTAAAGGKIGLLLDLLRRPDGATLFEMMDASGWQAHSVRGAIAGQIKKKLGFTVTSEKPANERIYRIPSEAEAAPAPASAGRKAAKKGG